MTSITVSTAQASGKFRARRRLDHLMSRVLLVCAYWFSNVFVAVLFASRPIGPIADDQNYLNYLGYALTRLGSTLNRVVDNPLYFFVNEPLWLTISGGVGSILNPEAGLRLIILISVSVLLVSLGRLTGRPWLTLLLFVVFYPVTKNYVIHLRQGVAMTLFFAGLAWGGRQGTILRWMAPFVHTSYWVVLVAEYWERVGRGARLSWKVRLAGFVTVALCAVAAIPFIGQIAGDRRVAEYAFAAAEGLTGLGAVFWFVVLGFLILFARKERHTMLLGFGTVFYLATFLFLDFSARIFESFIPFAILAVPCLRGYYRVVYILILVAYGIAAWMMSSSWPAVLTMLLG